MRTIVYLFAAAAFLDDRSKSRLEVRLKKSLSHVFWAREKERFDLVHLHVGNKRSLNAQILGFIRDIRLPSTFSYCCDFGRCDAAPLGITSI